MGNVDFSTCLKRAKRELTFFKYRQYGTFKMWYLKSRDFKYGVSFYFPRTILKIRILKLSKLENLICLRSQSS